MSFAKTTFGPPAPTGVDGDKGALLADVASGILDMVDQDGNCHGIETMFVVSGALTALTTITTVRTVVTKTLKAQMLNKTGRTLRISGSMIFSTAAANTPTITLAVLLGGGTVVTITSAAVAASTTNGQIAFDFYLTTLATGTAGTSEAHGQLIAQLSATLGTACAQYQDQNVAPVTAIDYTSALALAITITAAGGTVASAQLRQLFVEVIN